MNRRAECCDNLAADRTDVLDLTFTRDHRLLNGEQFSRVFAAPRRSSDRFFTVLVRENGGSHARLGLAVAKKRVRLAVGRNRIKRLVRESFRHNAHLLGAVDVVVLSRFDGNADNSDLSQSLLTHWKRLRMKQRRSEH